MFLANSLKFSLSKEKPEIKSVKVGTKGNLLLWRVFSFFLVFLIWELAGRSDISLAFPPFSSIYQVEGSRRKPGVKKIFQKMLVLAFEVIVQPLKTHIRNWVFFRVFLGRTT